MPASGTGVDGVGLRGFSLRGCGVVAPLPPAPGGIVGAITSGTTVFGAPTGGTAGETGACAWPCAAPAASRVMAAAAATHHGAGPC